MTSLPFPSEIGFQTVPVGAKEGRLSEERTSVTLTLPLGPPGELELTSAEVLELAPVEVSELQREVLTGQQKSSVSHALSPNVISRIEDANPTLPVAIFGFLLTIVGIPIGKFFHYSFRIPMPH